MTDEIYRPRSWVELFALPNLATEPIVKELMIRGKLRGDYEMEAKTGLQPCGIEQCHTPHRRGYVVVLPDQRLSYIGKDCGKTKFGAEWNRVRSDFSRLKREHAKTSALRELRQSVAEQIRDWPNLEDDHTAWARAVLSAFDTLPDPLRNILTNRAEQGDTSIPSWREETAAEVAQRKFHSNSTKELAPRRIQFDRGPLRGLQGVRRSSRVDRILDVRIPDLIAEARALSDDIVATTEQLDGIRRRLRAVISDVAASVRNLQAFVAQSNLNLLPFIRPVQQLGVVAVEFDNGPPPRFRVSSK